MNSGDDVKNSGVLGRQFACKRSAVMAGGAYREGGIKVWLAVGYRFLRHALVSWVHM